MKLILTFLALIFFVDGCAFTYRMTNPHTFVQQRAMIEQATRLHDDRPFEFLRSISLDTIMLAHGELPLGSGFVYRFGAYGYSHDLYFWIGSIALEDSVFSFAASPFRWHNGAAEWDALESVYEQCGWSSKPYHTFQAKLTNYSFSTRPVGMTRPWVFARPILDSMMSPYYGMIYSPDCPQSRALKRDGMVLTDDEAFALLHALNPVTRFVVAKEISLNSDKYSIRNRQYVDSILASPDQIVEAQFGCIVSRVSFWNLINTR